MLVMPTGERHIRASSNHYDINSRRRTVRTWSSCAWLLLSWLLASFVILSKSHRRLVRFQTKDAGVQSSYVFMSSPLKLRGQAAARQDVNDGGVALRSEDTFMTTEQGWA